MLAVAFSSDGLTVSGESDQGEFKSWDQRTGEVKRRLSAGQANPSLIAASMDGTSFAEVSDGALLRWDANSASKAIVPVAGKEPATALALSADGQLLALASRSVVTLLSPSGEVSKKLGVQEGVVNRLGFSKDGSCSQARINSAT